MLMDLCKDVRDKNRSGSRSRRGAVIIRADPLSTSGREEVAAGLCITAISFSIHSQKKILQAIESEKIPFKTISPTRAITRNRFPFTSTQWQELEHQALIYKYMVSGVPVPPELLYAVKRSLESSLASRLFPHQPSGWGCFQAGFGRKADPEPGRCRRTDGKKWRCSKEAYPDSKYCERHMHRGKSRSRKPVELTSSTPTTAATIPLTSINRNLSNPTVSPSSSSYSFSHPSSSAESEIYAHQNSSHRTFLYPHSSSSGPPESVFSPLNSTPHNLFLEPGSSPHADKQHRHYHGMREDVDERDFFPDGLVRARGVEDSYNQLPMSSYKGYSLPQFQTFADTSKEEQPQPGQHCFVLGTDIIKSSATRSIKLEKETETLKPLHHFFDQWEPKDADSWLDLASSSRPHNAGYSCFSDD